MDGFVLDVPDTRVNRTAFGGPVDGRAETFKIARTRPP